MNGLEREEARKWRETQEAMRTIPGFKEAYEEQQRRAAEAKRCFEMLDNWGKPQLVQNEGKRSMTEEEQRIDAIMRQYK